jgi:hypothetical protein
LKLECTHFLDSIRGGTTPITCGRRGCEVVQILELATRSLREKGAAQKLVTPNTRSLGSTNGASNGNGSSHGHGASRPSVRADQKSPAIA